MHQLLEPLASGALDLDVVAPPGCPGSREVLVRAEALLGAPVATTLRDPLRARVTITQLGPEDFVLRFDTAQGGGQWTRRVKGQSCEELADASALMLALAVDPHLMDHPARPRVEPLAPAVAPNVTPTPGASRAPAAAANSGESRRTGSSVRRSGRTPWVELGAVVDEGALPGAAPGLALGVGVAAQRELSAKRAGQAFGLLEQHARRFPQEALREERLAVRVVALCELGRVLEARQATEEFLREAPESPLVPRVRAACGHADGGGRLNGIPTAGFSEMGAPRFRD